MRTLYKILEEQVRSALAIAFPEEALSAEKEGHSLNPQLVRATKPEFGDFQVNGALTLAKTLKKPPQQIANAKITHLLSNKNFNDLCNPPKIAGPGFINITIQKKHLIEEIQARLNDHRLGVPSVQSQESG